MNREKAWIYGGEQLPNLNSILVYTSPKFGELRAAVIDDEVMFVETDVAAALGYGHCWKSFINRANADSRKTVRYGSSDVQQTMTFINTAGVCQLVDNSNMPLAKEYGRWIVNDVLRSIYKYICSHTEVSDIPQPVPAGWEYTEQYIRELMEENAEQECLLQEYELKASYCDCVLQAKNTISITKIAKDYGYTAQQMNRLLHEKGIQFKQGDV